MIDPTKAPRGVDVRAARAAALAKVSAEKSRAANQQWNEIAQPAATATPGATPAVTPLPPLPNAPGTPQPSDAERAAIEARWRLQRDVPRSLAQLIILVNAHPEWLAWARAAEGGTMEFNG